MIISDKQNTVERFNMPNEGKFHIETSAMAFRTLSQTIYSNPIKAIVRELSTNAYDAHIMVGKRELPFSVHLPTNLEPYFSIRDFGTGLSHDEVCTIYTTYFFSNKRDSNDFVGCLGLGSKSPFSYTDNYTVISYLDGVARTYAMFIDESGCPSVSLMSEDATDESNGMEIKLSVKSNYDNSLFREAATEVYQYFDIKPTVNMELTCDVNYVDEGDTWKRRANTHSNYVVMGQICYALDIHRKTHIDEIDAEGNNVLDAQGHKVKQLVDLGEFYEFLDKFPVTLFLPTGAVSITASRESLEYNSQTICTLYSYLTKYKLEIMDRFQKKIDGCASLFQARNMANKEFFHLRKFSNLVYNGEKLTIDTDIDVSCTIRKFHLKRKRGSYNQASVKRSSPSYISMCPESQVVLVYKDENKTPIAKCDQYIRATNLEQRINLYLIEGSLEQLQEIKEKVGACDEDIIMLSSLPYQAPERSDGGGRYYCPVDEVYTLASSHGSTKRSYWDTTKVDINQPGVYEVISNYSVDGYDPCVTDKLVEAINNLIGDTDISFITPSKVKSFTKKGWVHLREYLSQVLDTIDFESIKESWIANNTISALEDMNVLDTFRKLRGQDIELIDEICEYCKEDSSNYDIILQLTRLHQYMSYGEYGELEQVKKLVTIKNCKTVDNDVIEKVNSFIESFPMLFLIDSDRITADNKDTIINYLVGETNVSSVY